MTRFSRAHSPPLWPKRILMQWWEPAFPKQRLGVSKDF